MSEQDRAELTERIREQLGGLVDITIAARYLDSSESSIYHWTRPISKGGKGLPHYKISSRIKFRISELEEWLETKKVVLADDHENGENIDGRKIPKNV